MHVSKSLAWALLGTSAAQAFSLPEISLPEISGLTRRVTALLSKRDKGGGGGGGDCPAVWANVAADLKALFLDRSTSQCNDDARAAIREMFHDCGTWTTAQGNTGGCDGSLILAGETSRSENNGLQDISAKLLNLSKKWKVGVADTIVFAASVAVAVCPGGPSVTTYVGRKDSSTPAPDGGLPDMHASGESLYQLFLAKGIKEDELAALLGAHTTSKSFHQTPVGLGDQGFPQDSTPGIWDVKYYSDTTNPPAGVFVFDSDKNLAAHPVVGPKFKGFVNNPGKWNSAFGSALTKMSLFGVPGGKQNLQDCTKVVPQGTSKRDIKAAPVNNRAR